MRTFREFGPSCPCRQNDREGTRYSIPVSVYMYILYIQSKNHPVYHYISVELLRYSELGQQQKATLPCSE